MRLIIKELGIIKQAEIDLGKQLTLFCGRNSTGKTYASYILHAFLDDGNVYPLDCIKDIMDQIVKNGRFQITKDFVDEWIGANCKFIMDNIGNIFGISDVTKNKLFSKFILEAIYSDSDYNEAIRTPINAQLVVGTNFWRISKSENSDIINIECDVDKSQLAPNSMRAALLVCHILRHLAFCEMLGVRMLTVERNSIYTFKTELSLSRNELIDQIQQTSKSEIDIFDIINKSSRRYPYAIRCSLKIANDLENVQKADSPFAEIANQIEKDLLLGEVSTTKNGDVEFHAQGMAAARRLPFHLSSSIVKTMASLVIYLRHLAKCGDTLIIDEPEMNFHPDVQILLAQIFAILANNGIHVVVSTHSDYIVREINNLIMAGALANKNGDELYKELGYTKDMLLNYNDVNVLHFVKKGKSSVRVTSLDIDEEGFAIDTIDSAINQQNIKAEQLYAHLLENK